VFLTNLIALFFIVIVLSRLKVLEEALRWQVALHEAGMLLIFTCLKILDRRNLGALGERVEFGPPVGNVGCGNLLKCR